MNTNRIDAVQKLIPILIYETSEILASIWSTFDHFTKWCYTKWNKTSKLLVTKKTWCTCSQANNKPFFNSESTIDVVTMWGKLFLGLIKCCYSWYWLSSNTLVYAWMLNTFGNLTMGLWTHGIMIYKEKGIDKECSSTRGSSPSLPIQAPRIILKKIGQRFFIVNQIDEN
jgi:hypothetical protein